MKNQQNKDNQEKDLFQKCLEYDVAKKVQQAGVYPYFRAIQETQGSTVVSHDERRVMIGSNNYLGLTHHPRVREAAKRAIDKFGTGCTGSRFLNGNLSIHEELEDRLSKFLGKEKVLVFNSGFLANQGSISSLVGRKDVIYSDRENHASIVEGTRVSIGTTLKFRHNDIEELERIVQKTRGNYEGALIIADGVFSMSGEILKLPEIIEVARKYNCRVYVDDAHGVGVLGPRGEGTAHHFQLQDQVDLIMGTFSKSFASLGGYIAGPVDVIDFIKHTSRPFIFSAAMPPASVAAVLECINLLEEDTSYIKSLWKNAHKMKKSLKEMGYNTLHSETPIIPLFIGDDFAAFSFAKRLYEEGVFATPVVKPAVPDGCALIRTSYMASHTDEDLNYVLDVLQKLGKEFNIIGQNSQQEELEARAKTFFRAEVTV